MLTAKQQRFVELEKRKEEVRKYYEELQASIVDLISEYGLNSYFQDDQGTVYKLIECDGKFVKFDRFTYCRTKRPGEERGTLSIKEAREHGFQID